jgi:3-oxoacyl-[acyl-carrier-protein] synthase-3
MQPRGNGIGIVGMGECLPDEVRTNDFWPADWREVQTRKLPHDLMASVDEAAAKGAKEVDPEIVRYAGPYFADLFRGVKERRVIGHDQMPSDLEAGACRAAMVAASVEPHEIDALIGYSAVQDLIGVENTGLVSFKLGLRNDVAALAVTAACASFVYQIRVASRLVEAGEFNKVLVFVSSAGSLIMDYGSPASVVPGDVAVAAVISRVEDGHGYVGTTTSTHGELHRAILVVPQEASVDTPWWRGDGGPFVAKRGDAFAGHYVGTHAASVCRPTVQRLLEKTGAHIEDVAYMAVSQAGAWFGRAMADSVGLDHSRILSFELQFARYGHLMAGSVALNLLLGHRHGHIKKGDLVLLYSPGLGFVTSASLMRWSWAA